MILINRVVRAVSPRTSGAGISIELRDNQTSPVTNLTWVLYSLAAVTGGLLAAALLNRIRSPQEGRNRRLSRTLWAAGALVLLLAYFNVFGESPLAANAGALLCFVAAARLSTLNRHPAAAN